MTPSWYEDHNISAIWKMSRIYSRFWGDLLRSERFRRQFHGGRASRLDPRKMQRGFRQHPLHEEAAGHELGGQIRRGTACRNLGQRHFRPPRPHLAAADAAESL